MLDKHRRKVFALFAAMLGGALTAKKASANAKLSTEEIARAWQDPKFRSTLSKSQWESLPTNPAGEVRHEGFNGGLAQISGNNCSGNNCSGNNCSGNNCSGNNCSGNNCSGNSCSGNNCSGNNCSGNNCSGFSCGG